MQLKSLQIQGFKSFPDKTELMFGRGLTAVVGPNGSGKSNISDAVRWVLGEQSTRNLRGEKMEDVIFLGTHNRKPTGFASVSLTIDNADRQLPIDADDVTITRRLYRSGESEYRLNKTAVRLKDITELLMDTGLGRDGYSIIGQGRIEEIVAAKSTQRREIFEEAAGISKYRYRKAEAEKKLENAYENLLRLKDILSELEGRVGPLREQSEKAERFLKLAQEKKTLEISLWINTIEKLRADLVKKEEECLIAKNRCADINAILDEFQHRIEQDFEQAQQYALLIDEQQRAVSSMRDQQSSCDAGIAVAQNDLQHNNTSIEQTNAEILSYTENKDETKTRLKENEAQLMQKRAELQKAQSDSEEVRQEIVSVEEEIAALGDRIAALKGKRAAFEQDITRQKLNRVSSDALLEETTQRLQRLRDSSTERDDGIAALQKEKENCQQLLLQIAQQEQSLQNTQSGYQLKLKRHQQTQQALEEECSDIQRTIDQHSHRAGILAEMEKSMEGYYSSVKNVLSQSASGRLHGIIGTVSQILSVSPQYTVAIETALGGALQNIVTENQNAAKNAINHLKYTRAGRATFLPADILKPQTLDANGIERMEGFVARASDLVSCEPKLKNIAENLLGRIAVAQDIDAAVAIARHYQYRFRVVTLDGQLVNAGGSMTGGSISKNTGLLSRKEEIDTLQKKIADLNKRLASYQPQREQMKQMTAQLQAQIDSVAAQIATCGQDKITYTTEHKRIALAMEEALHARQQMEEECARQQKRLEELRSSSTNADSLIDQVNRELGELRDSLEQNKHQQEQLEEAKQFLQEQQHTLRLDTLGLQKDIESLEAVREQLEGFVSQQNSHVQMLVDKLNTLQNEGRLLRKKIEELYQTKQTLTQDIQAAQQKTVQLQQQRAEAEQKLVGLRNEEKEQIARRERAAAEQSRCEEKKALMQGEYDKLIAKLWEEYNMTRSEALSQAQPVEDEPRAQSHLADLKSKIRALGSVNVAAIEEYREVSERYDFLNRQCDDVERSRTELLGLIRELTAQMKELFADSFERINRNFQQIFTELFGGGQAKLTLTDPDNLLESGIEITVQPPGKIIKNLSALSGGEKAFVAIAIYFAILKVKPSPFCILDEIEAALDEVNVSRYARYLKNLSDKTQFIAITHRRGTMEEADILYGVTMQEKGVSRLLELDVTQVESRLGMKS